MSRNPGYEPDANDSGDDRGTSAENRSAPNEELSYNVHLDTYFSDEKVQIPDDGRVSPQKT